jgi:hypothetical protein
VARAILPRQKPRVGDGVGRARQQVRERDRRADVPRQDDQ